MSSSSVHPYDTGHNAPEQQHRLGECENEEHEGRGMMTPAERKAHSRRRTVVAFVLALLFTVAIAIALGAYATKDDEDPHAVATTVLRRSPVIDGHIDLPILARDIFANNVSAINLYNRMPGQVDIPRLRAGHVGAFFWSVYVPCAPDNEIFTCPSYRVRDTLEQIDVAHLLMEGYPEVFRFVKSASGVREAIHEGKIAGLLGVEGGHQLGNSLGVLRQYYRLGVRYVTLTHVCHNAFADSGGMFEVPTPLNNGLSPFGRALVRELIRLGMLVDLSHTSDSTASQAMAIAASIGAPVLFSHSAARGLYDIPRNVPDELLGRLVRWPTDRDKYEGRTDGVVMVTFVPGFIGGDGGEERLARGQRGDGPDLQRVADHIEYIGRAAGRAHVGLGSDFDGTKSGPRGLEDSSKYPDLIAELAARGWSHRELAGLTGGNVLRILEGAESVAKELYFASVDPAMEIYSKRPDLPVRKEEEEDVLGEMEEMERTFTF